MIRAEVVSSVDGEIHCCRTFRLHANDMCQWEPPHVYLHVRRVSSGRGCRQEKSVDRRKCRQEEVSTGGECRQGPSVDRDRVSTGTECRQGPSVDRERVSTGAECQQASRQGWALVLGLTTEAVERDRVSTGKSVDKKRASSPTM